PAIVAVSCFSITGMPFSRDEHIPGHSQDNRNYLTTISVQPQNGCSADPQPSASVDPDTLGVEIGVEVFDTTFAAIAAHAVPPEGHRRIECVIGIDPDGARADRTGNAVRLADIPGPHAARQAEGGLICARNHLVLIIERQDRNYRAEDFL